MSPFLKSLSEKLVKTFVVTFVALWVGPLAPLATNDPDATWEYVTDLANLQKAWLAAVAVVIRLLVAVVESRVGDHNSASFIDAGPDKVPAAAQP